MKENLTPKGRSMKVNNCCKVYENGVIVCGNKIIKPTVTSGGLMVRVNRKNCNLNKMVHTIVAEAFIPKPNDEYHYDVHHKNGNKFDNRVENLEWKRRGIDLIKKKGSYKPKKKVPILQIDPKSKKIIREYSNLKEAAMQNGIAYSQLASARAKGEIYRGYLWVRKNDYLIRDIRDVLSVSTHGLKLNDLDGFLKAIQRYILDGVVEVNVENEDGSITTYAVYSDGIREVIENF